MRTGRLTNDKHTAQLRQVLLDAVCSAGMVLRGYFGRITNPRLKGSSSSVVCDADLAAEKIIMSKIRRAFPGHGIIAEESGYVEGEQDYTWVVDPLDGTSNFVAGLPWFGVQIGVLKGTKVVMAAMYLPLENLLYYAERGGGTTRNGTPVELIPEKRLKHTLCAFGFDPDVSQEWRRRNVELLFRFAGGVRNIRATNSLVDFCLTLDGRLGGFANLCTMIWDIVPVSLILPEAGGRFTGLDGRPIEFDPGPQSCKQVFKVLGASKALHPKLLKLTSNA